MSIRARACGRPGTAPACAVRAHTKNAHSRSASCTSVAPARCPVLLHAPQFPGPLPRRAASGAALVRSMAPWARSAARRSQPPVDRFGAGYRRLQFFHSRPDSRMLCVLCTGWLRLDRKRLLCGRSSYCHYVKDLIILRGRQFLYFGRQVKVKCSRCND
jgi:hypothetical protein